MYQTYALRILLLTLVVFATSESCFSQDLLYETFGTKDGLPSPETYFAHQDKKGYMWFGTDRGLSRYDGYKFTNFTTQNSKLTNNTIFKCYEAPNSELWFSCYDGSISIYNLDSQAFRPFPYNDSLKKWFKYWPKRIDFTEDGVEIYGFNENYYKAVVNHSGVTYRRILAKKIGTYGVGNNYEQYELYIGQGSNLCLFTNKVNYFMDSAKDSRRLLENSIGTLSRGYFADGKKLYEINGSLITLISTFSSNINHIRSARIESLIIFTNDGVWLIQEKELIRLAIDAKCSFGAIDVTGKLWLTTLNQGVVRVNNYNNLFLSSPTCLNKEGCKNIKYSKDTMFLISENSPSLYPTSVIARNLNKDSIVLDSSTKQRLKSVTTSDVRCQIEIMDSVTIYIAYEPGYIISTEGGSLIHVDTKTEQLKCVEVDNNGNMWTGSQSGLWLVKKEQLQTPINISDSLNINASINTIKKRESGVVIGSNGEGLFFIKSEIEMFLNSTTGLVSDFVNSMTFSDDSTLWVGTNRGISKVIVTKAIDNSYVELSLGVEDGLPSNYIYDLKYWNNALWVGTDKGLVELPEERLQRKSVAPFMNLEKAQIAHTEQDISNPTLRYSENNVQFSYVGICFSKPEENFYRYRLIHNGKTEDYRSTNLTDLHFYDLAKGDYIFEIACVNKNNIWSNTATFKFTILPHFSQTLWFKILVILLTLTLIIWYLINAKKRRDHMEYSIEVKQLSDIYTKEEELGMLRTQMNPHFIFNALNSIKSFINENEISKATTYVHSFSKLVRASLDNSKNQWIPLKNEIEFLKSYLNIERMRFQERFDFSIKCDFDYSSDDFMIPPLLLQPLVENCVKHAFGNKEGGFINIEISLLKEGYECLIEDNGIGFMHAPESKHMSYGSLIVTNRLKLLETKNFTPSIKFLDKSDFEYQLDNPTNETGTLVIIKIPRK